MSDRYYVQIDRDDGSRTYKGAWSLPHCEREAAAWREYLPHYDTRIVPRSEASADVRSWSRTIAEGHRYYPSDDGTELLGSQARPRY